MIYRVKIGRWRFTFTLAPTSTVTGVNSKLPNGKHIAMWDFDHITLWDVAETLKNTQLIYALPNIYILETKSPMLEINMHGSFDPKDWEKNREKHGNYIAYCFKGVEWRKLVEMIAYTKHVDWGFIKFGVYRGHFTLRVTPKSGRRPRLVQTLKSNVQADASIADLQNWVKYETLEDGYPVKTKEWKVG